MHCHLRLVSKPVFFLRSAQIITKIQVPLPLNFIWKNNGKTILVNPYCLAADPWIYINSNRGREARGRAMVQKCSTRSGELWQLVRWLEELVLPCRKCQGVLRAVKARKCSVQMCCVLIHASPEPCFVVHFRKGSYKKGPPIERKAWKL